MSALNRVDMSDERIGHRRARVSGLVRCRPLHCPTTNPGHAETLRRLKARTAQGAGGVSGRVRRWRCKALATGAVCTHCHLRISILVNTPPPRPPETCNRAYSIRQPRTASSSLRRAVPEPSRPPFASPQYSPSREPATPPPVRGRPHNGLEDAGLVLRPRGPPDHRGTR